MPQQWDLILHLTSNSTTSNALPRSSNLGWVESAQARISEISDKYLGGLKKENQGDKSKFTSAME